jgi:hypothetical protein
MGFMDKAKKLAEQAQDKLDEVQKQFNESQGSSQQQPAPVEYDEHGRPQRAESAPPPAEAATPPHGDPVAPAPSADEPERKDEYAPPKLTGGDPLAG